MEGPMLHRHTLSHTESYHLVYWESMPPEAPSASFYVVWHRSDVLSLPRADRHIIRPTREQAHADAAHAISLIETPCPLTRSNA